MSCLQQVLRRESQVFQGEAGMSASSCCSWSSHGGRLAGVSSLHKEETSGAGSGQLPSITLFLPSFPDLS